MTVTGIHHLNCATMRPAAARVPGLLPESLVAHCLLVEAGDRLVLVDTGFGTADVADHRARFGRTLPTLLGVRFDPAETALSRLTELGRSADDVTDIVLTHLDLDHAGGLPDFPRARVHVHQRELDAITTPDRRERLRYFPVQWSHDPTWVPHAEAAGERWFGFESATAIADDVVIVPLPGHTRGHSGVAVRRPDGGWLLHAGDAYFHDGDKQRPRHCPAGLRAFQAGLAIDSRQRRANLGRLQDLHAQHADEVTVFCAHDRAEFDRLA